MRIIILIFSIIFSLQINAQNLFPVKLNNCKTESFCLDCGDPKAGYNQEEFNKLQKKLTKELYLKGTKGSVRFQVLVAADGSACVLSHTDESENPITVKIIEELNKFKGWIPAITKEVKKEKSSIVLAFTIINNKITAKIERVDIDAFVNSFDRPNDPQIFNKVYNYKNDNLGKYKMTVWNSKNSNLPNNMNDHISIDKDGLIWLTVDGGLVTFDGRNFKRVGPDITGKDKIFGYHAIATDNDNVKWFYASTGIYSFNNAGWKFHDLTESGISGAYEIINNPKTGELFFCTDKGLVIRHDYEWSSIDSRRFKNLQLEKVVFAKRDSKNRIWIGTFNGTIMIDEDDEVINFEKTNTILKGKCITSMDEDENGNLYFSLFEFDRKNKSKINNDEGIAIRYNDGTIKQFTSENSGMPFNHTNCVLYDKNEKILWISTDRAGLVRFDLKDGWENYHNLNSAIPTSYISTMTFDEKGNLWLATRQGLVKVERK